MPPTQIVRDIRMLIQSCLLPATSKRWQGLVRFGLTAYALKPFQSANGNARSAEQNTHTAGRKCERLLANMRLADHLGVICDSLNVVCPRSFLNIDHSDMNGLLALVAAVQTRKGRAIPCMLETTYSNHLSARKDAPLLVKRMREAWRSARRRQSFTGHVIDSLQNLHDRLGFWPRLVFDRGFGNESIVNHLAAEGATFYIRLKAGRYVELDGERITVGELTAKDAAIELFGLQLRIVRSSRSRRCKQPWYILTNDFMSSRAKIVRIYYHRFEIEETFKDAKHIFELKRTRLTRPNSLKVILWFIAIGIALLYFATKPTKQQLQTSHAKKRLSWLRAAYEQYQHAVAASVLLTG